MSTAHRIETSRPGSHIRVSLGDTLLAESADAVLLRERRLPDRWYVPRSDVRVELFDSAATSHCPFKGDARYLSVRLPDGEVVEDLVWYYPEPIPEVADIAGRVCFYTERGVDVAVDQAA